MTSTEPRSEYFETTLAASGNNTGIVVPDGVIERLGAGKRPPVVVDVNGHEYRSTVAVMGGRYLIGFPAAHRAATGLAGGDPHPGDPQGCARSEGCRDACRLQGRSG